jgi:broad specificity phosphatase PhoE
VASFEDIVETNKGYQVLVVTHDVIVRLLTAYCLGASSSIYRRLEAGNASLTIIQVGDGWRRLRLMNDRGHLEAEQR